MQLYSFPAMNTEILLAAEGRADDVSSAFWTTQLFVEACERRFTRFSDDSELSALNRHAGAWFPASPQLLEVVSLALTCHEQTGGLFDPSVLPDLRRAGYTRSMELIRQEGAEESPEPGTPRERIPFSDIEVRPEGGLIRLPRGMSLDLGGIAKGWIAEGAARLLSSYVPACAVDAGGDMFLAGLPEGELSWSVEIEDPRNPLATLTTLEVGPGAVATSSVVKRAWSQGGRQRHHLIDPRTGEPATTDWLSVTVVAPHAHVAEVFAKALLIAGPGEAGKIASGNAQIAYLAASTEGIVRNTLETSGAILVGTRGRSSLHSGAEKRLLENLDVH
jgi:thiamine biosynthesis lipoprotein